MDPERVGSGRIQAGTIFHTDVQRFTDRGEPDQWTEPKEQRGAATANGMADEIVLGTVGWVLWVQHSLEQTGHERGLIRSLTVLRISTDIQRGEDLVEG